MQKIDGIIVVEGKTDVAFLSTFLDAEFVTTNGSEISEETIDYIKQISLKKNVYVLTDPDSPGKRIRDVLDQHIPNLHHCFVDKAKSIKHNKVGVAESTQKEVLNALKFSLKTTNEQSGKLTMNDMIKLGLSGTKESSFARERVAKTLHLGYGNAKTILKRLNSLNITYNEIEKLL